MRPGEDMEYFTDWAGKATGAATRIAGVLHSIKYAHHISWETLISEETMRHAISILEVITQHSLAAIDMMGADPKMALAHRVLAWIERTKLETFTLRDAFSKLRSLFKKVDELKPVLAILEDHGYIKVFEHPKATRGRPPSPWIEVHPDLIRKWTQ